MKNMKKLFFLLTFMLAACTPHPVAVTRLDEEQFDRKTVSVDSLPFAMTLPEEWSVNEEAFLYTLSFDDGASGYIQIKKEPVEEPLGCTESGAKTFCVISAGDRSYSFVLTDKGMSAERRAEAEAILRSVKPKL